MDQKPSVDNANQRLKIRIKQLTILHDIARAVTSVLDLQSVLNRIVEAAVYLTGAEEGLIMLADEASRELHLRAGKGLGDKAAKVMRVPVNDSLAGHVMQTGKPLRMGGQQDGDSFKVKTGYLVKSLLNVPIKGQNGILGVLSVDHAIESMKTFSDYDISLLSHLAEYAAIAIENARRFEEATRRADELSQALQEAGAPPELPSRDADRQSLETFNQGLRNQREEINRVQSDARNLAQTLRTNAETIDDIAQRLGVWNEDAENLLPQLDWIAQTALRQKATGHLNNRPASDGAASIIEVLLQNLADGILLCNTNGNVLKANAAAARILNLDQAALAAQNLQTIFPSDARWEQLIGSFRLALTLGDKQLPPPPPSSATFFQNSRFIKASLVSLPKNNYLGAAMLVILRDISMEMAGWIARDETVNNLSENLRTPMAAANSYSDLLLSESVGLITTAQRRYLQRICRAIDLMEATLVDFTGQSRHVLPKTQLSKVNLIDIFNEAIEAAREELTLAGVNLDPRLDQNLPPANIVPEYFTKIMTDLLIRAGAHMQVGETMLLTTEIQEENDQPAYLVVTLHNQSPRLDPARQLDEDPHLKSLADAVKYQGGRLWLETDYQGRWRICFLLPVAS